MSSRIDDLKKELLKKGSALIWHLLVVKCSDKTL